MGERRHLPVQEPRARIIGLEPDGHIVGRCSSADSVALDGVCCQGGIGRCTTTHDCVAEGNEDLMFMKVRNLLVTLDVSDHPPPRRRNFSVDADS